MDVKNVEILLLTNHYLIIELKRIENSIQFYVLNAIL